LLGATTLTKFRNERGFLPEKFFLKNKKARAPLSSEKERTGSYPVSSVFLPSFLPPLLPPAQKEKIISIFFYKIGARGTKKGTYGKRVAL
jgi:hypothetical protein